MTHTDDQLSSASALLFYTALCGLAVLLTMLIVIFLRG